jgi:hypothetical protein
VNNESTVPKVASPSGKPGPGGDHHKTYSIHIDRDLFKVDHDRLTGLELRRLPTTPIPDTRDLFLVVPGGLDELIGDNQVVELKEGMHFVTAPRNVTPGAVRGR